MKLGRPKLTDSRKGTTGYNNFGTLMKVIEYYGSGNILIEFEKGDRVINTWDNFIKGSLKSLYDKDVHGVGYLGEGTYKSRVNGNQTKRYHIWSSMITRCYNVKLYKKFPSYSKCFVNDDWHNFQNFAKWYDENYYEIGGEKMCLDKDILVKGNKEYSESTCIFVPDTINKLFIKREDYRNNLPIGVHFSKRDNIYVAQCSDPNGRKRFLGRYDSPEAAFYAYKKRKEQLIKQTAEEYKDKIPAKLYNAMVNYIVEITD
jgi:hypothetical protein